jgi:hypothetical protein
MPPTPPLRFTGAGDDVVEGLLCPFYVTDTFNTRFTPRTAFHLSMFPDGARPLMWHHGLDEETGATPVGRITQLWQTSQGLMMRAALDRAGTAFRKVRDAIKKGAVGLSSGSLAHLVSIDHQTGEILQWPVIEGSLTPAPACAAAVITRHTVRADAVRAHYRAAGLPVPDLPPRGRPQAGDGSAADALHYHARYLTLLRRDARQLLRDGPTLLREVRQQQLAALNRYQLDLEARQLECDLTRLEGALRRRREAQP